MYCLKLCIQFTWTVSSTLTCIYTFTSECCREWKVYVLILKGYGCWMFSGDYGPDMTKTKLKDFHRRRLLVLADAGADLLAFETIPCKLEAQVFY